jgi:hypothetical protein
MASNWRAEAPSKARRGGEVFSLVVGLHSSMPFADFLRFGLGQHLGFATRPLGLQEFDLGLERRVFDSARRTSK